MMIYSMRKCEDCTRTYAVFWRAWANEFVFCRPQTLNEVTTRPTSETCPHCSAKLHTVVPYAVRTTDGDWLAVNPEQTVRALAN